MMLFNVVFNFDISTSMAHNMNTSKSCLLLILLLYIIDNTLSIIANNNAQNSIVTPSTTIIVETSMVNAIIPSITLHAGINRCRTVVSTITVTVVVTITTITMIAINTIIIIITSTRAVMLAITNNFLGNTSMSTNPIATTISTSITTNMCQ